MHVCVSLPKARPDTHVPAMQLITCTTHASFGPCPTTTTQCFSSCPAPPSPIGGIHPRSPNIGSILAAAMLGNTNSSEYQSLIQQWQTTATAYGLQSLSLSSNLQNISNLLGQGVNNLTLQLAAAAFTGASQGALAAQLVPVSCWPCLVGAASAEQLSQP